MAAFQSAPAQAFRRGPRQYPGRVPRQYPGRVPGQHPGRVPRQRARPAEHCHPAPASLVKGAITSRMQYMVTAIFWLAGELIHLMILAIIAAAVVSMLISFGVVNARSQFVYTIADFLNRVTYPVLRPIQRHMPTFGNVDLSPLIAILLLEALQMVLADVYAHLVMAGLNY
ncbi:MAG: hypothetical protein B7Z80_08440 [Rhodospirillales bacterium 20-64-7]|nr:MAG: hypothetical protein B7Z80_08440 [Rhodospirillales bacterium 20-64-7]